MDAFNFLFPPTHTLSFLSSGCWTRSINGPIWLVGWLALFDSMSEISADAGAPFFSLPLTDEIEAVHQSRNRVP